MFNDQPASAAPDAPAEAPASDVPTAEGGASAEQLEQLLVLSQAPLSLDEAPVEETQRAESGPEAALATGSVMPLMAQYVRLLVQMLGVGMITATVRHYGDNPKLYLGLALGGALMFAVASTLLDRRPAGGSLLSAVRYGVLSAVLATGLGLLIGGVLHFTAFPKTAAVLVPLGLGLSIAAFVLRDGQQLMGRSFISTGVTIVGVLVWVGIGLGLGAKKLEPSPVTPAAAAHDAGAADHGAAAGDDHAAPAAGDHGEAAAGDHGEAAAGDHGEAAAGDHAAPAAADHAAAPAEHGAADAADSHGAAPAGEHGAAKDDHAAPAKDAHGEASAAGHDSASDASHATSAAEEEEDELTAADVLPPKSH